MPSEARDNLIDDLWSSYYRRESQLETLKAELVAMLSYEGLEGFYKWPQNVVDYEWERRFKCT